MQHVAIFDLDGTLVDSAPAIARALNRLREQRNLPALATAGFRPWISQGAARLVAHALQLPMPADAAVLAEFRAVYAEQPGTPEDCYPGILKALQTLHHAGIPLGVCTNKPQDLSERVLHATGLSGLFAAVVGGDAVPRCKPDGAHLLQTREAMRCHGTAIDFIGDSRVDAEAAHACGARFLWASWGYAVGEDLAHRGLRLATPVDLPAAVLGHHPCAC